MIRWLHRVLHRDCAEQAEVEWLRRARARLIAQLFEERRGRH